MVAGLTLSMTAQIGQWCKYHHSTLRREPDLLKALVGWADVISG
jgi:hypothetical protein